MIIKAIYTKETIILYMILSIDTESLYLSNDNISPIPIKAIGIKDNNSIFNKETVFLISSLE